MSYCKMYFLTLVCCGLAACSTADEGPLTTYDANTAYACPAGSRAPAYRSHRPFRGQTYAQANTQGTQNPADLAVPPGSEAARQQTKQEVRMSRMEMSRMSDVSSGSQASDKPRAQESMRSASSSGDVVDMPYAQAWPKVGKALSSSGYQIMDQDSSIGAYYIVDKASTGGKIKRDTPIYQVHLKSQGNSTSINLLNAQNRPATPQISNRVMRAIKSKM